MKFFLFLIFLIVTGLKAQTDSSPTPGPKLYSKVLILSDINLTSLSWQDLGLENETSFKYALMASWLKWFTTHQSLNVSEVTLCQNTCVDEFNNWQQLGQDQEMKISENLVNSLWLKVSFNVKKVSRTLAINEWSFEWDGSVVLLDANTKRILSSHTLQSETKTWRGLDQKSLNSALASHMYRSPLGAFTQINRKIQTSPRLNRLSRLAIQGYKSMEDVQSLMNLLRKEGQKLHLEVQIDEFGQKETQLICFYQGEEKSFSDLLSRVKELKSSHSYRVVNELKGIHHVLKLIAE